MTIMLAKVISEIESEVRLAQSFLEKVPNYIGELRSELNIEGNRGIFDHYIFSCGKGKGFEKNQPSIDAAKATIESLEYSYDLEADITGHYSGPQFEVNESEDHFSIRAYSDDLITLMDGCIAFGMEFVKIKYNVLGKLQVP